jgi:hypothetical protein
MASSGIAAFVDGRGLYVPLAVQAA